MICKSEMIFYLLLSKMHSDENYKIVMIDLLASYVYDRYKLDKEVK